MQMSQGGAVLPPPWAVRAGARKDIYFNPAEVNVAIVTCGGLCPGLNDVVQGLVRKLEDYGVPDGNILGIKCAPCWVVIRVRVRVALLKWRRAWCASWRTTACPTATSWASSARPAGLRPGSGLGLPCQNGAGPGAQAGGLRRARRQRPGHQVRALLGCG